MRRCAGAAGLSGRIRPRRNAYLTAALELRRGSQALNVSQASTQGILMELTPGMIFDYMVILMDKRMMADQECTINVTLTDLQKQYILQVKNGVLLVYENARREDADASVTCPKNALLNILSNSQNGLSALPMEGNVELITLLAQSMNQFPVQGIMPFNIVEPKKICTKVYHPLFSHV